MPLFGTIANFCTLVTHTCTAHLFALKVKLWNINYRIMIKYLIAEFTFDGSSLFGGSTASNKKYFKMFLLLNSSKYSSTELYSHGIDLIQFLVVVLEMFNTIQLSYHKKVLTCRKEVSVCLFIVDWLELNTYAWVRYKFLFFWFWY